MSDDVRDLHTALLNLVGILNEPQRDEALIKAAGIALDRALFPLLVRIERNGPIGVVRLAELAGRDHTTVSRQVARLEELGPRGPAWRGGRQAAARSVPSRRRGWR
ncbi:MAG: MarR family transcriptional regulator [Rhizomicrobium sp.]